MFDLWFDFIMKKFCWIFSFLNEFSRQRSLVGGSGSGNSSGNKRLL
jgi:hypothetical protein